MDNNTPLAIVGFSYRAPGVGRKGLWEYLAESKSAFSKAPKERFDQDAYYHPNREKSGCISSKGAHFLPDDVYGFDAPFFNLRADEARAIDPQLRMILECSLEAAESAGLRLPDLAGANIGVFSAAGPNDYGQQIGEDLPSSTTWAGPGTAPCMFANRLSYFFDFSGPSIALDAACASSSYAVHIAAQSLRSRECDAAFVSASSLILSPSQWALLDIMGALSEEGKSFSYDSKASGFGRGEGGGCLIIKRLDEAIKNGDPIQAVMRNSACGHCGRSDGITMPRRSAQEELLLRVHQEAGLSPSETPVVEGHGTGTQVGDPIEAGAFATVLGAERNSSNPLYIGSLKSNFGHLEGASGLLAIIKAILMIQYGRFLPTAHFEKFNDNIEGSEKLKVATTSLPWPSNEPTRVLVTNFGFGGSNAAIILEEGPAGAQVYALSRKYSNSSRTSIHVKMPAKNESRSSSVLAQRDDSKKRLFLLSAKTDKSLTAYIRSFSEYLDTAPDSSDFLRDLSFTLGQRRTHHSFRAAVTADSMNDLKSQVSGKRPNKSKPRVLAYAFTGQGAQHPQMASNLQHYETFATSLKQAEKYLHDMGATWLLRDELGRDASVSRVNEAEISQPACTAVQIATVDLLRSWGVNPARVTGHSSGEIAAAYAAGLLSFQSAIAVAYFRGQAASQISNELHQKGSMLALGTSYDEAMSLVHQCHGGRATIAAINSPESVTISGDNDAVDQIHQLAEEKGLFARKLKVEVAYHSHHMEAVAASYLTAIKPYCEGAHSSAQRDKAEFPEFISSVLGGIVDGRSIDANYWVENLLQPVRFVEAIESLFTAPGKEESGSKLPNVVVEIGPHAALKSAIKQTLTGLSQGRDKRQVRLEYIPSLVRGTDGDEALLDLAGNLFAMGFTLDLAAINQTGQQNSRVVTTLPAYEWDKVCYIHKSRIASAKRNPGQAYHELLGAKSPYNEGGEHTFRQVFDLDQIPWIRDHNVAGSIIFPMTGYLSLAMEAFRRISPAAPATMLVREFHAKRSLEVEEDQRIEIATKLRPASTGTEVFSSTVWSFEVLTWTEEGGWVAHCHGLIEAETEKMTTDSPTLKESAGLHKTDNMKIYKGENEYAAGKLGGTLYGPAFQGMIELCAGHGYTVMETEMRDLDMSAASPKGSPVSVDPPTLDTFLQGGGPLSEINGTRSAMMPNYVSRLRVSNSIPAKRKQKFTVVTRFLDRDIKRARLRLSVAVFAQTDEGLIPVIELESIVFRFIGSARSQESTLPVTFNWDVVPSLDFTDNLSLAKILDIRAFSPADIPLRHKMDHLAILYMNKALQEVNGQNISEVAFHLGKFAAWAKKVVSQTEYSLDLEPSKLISDMDLSSASLQMLQAIGENLASILRGELQPLEIMLKDGLLTRHYEQDKGNALGSEMLAKCVGHLATAKPDMHILEIGGGTAGTTLPVLKELTKSSDNSPRFISYTFTDISAGFFDGSRKKLLHWSHYMKYKKLDIGQNPIEQGFLAEQYDLVIAANVLHATPDMTVTIDNVRTLLKPGGKLLLLEGLCQIPATLPFALLPGWWLTEDDYRDRNEGPMLSENSWRRLLSEKGFTGLDFSLADYPNKVDNKMSVMCSTRVARQGQQEHSAPITVCGPLLDDEEQEFAQMLSDHVSDQFGCATLVKPFLEIDPSDDPFCVFVDSSQHSLLSGLSEESFGVMKSAFLQSKGVLWIIPEQHSPDAEIVRGIMHTIRREDQSTNLVLLENVPLSSQSLSNISKIVSRLRTAEPGSFSHDLSWSNGMIHVPILRESATAKESFAAEANVTLKKMQNIWDVDESLGMTIDTAGNPDSIYFQRTNLLQQPVGKSEVLVRTEASGVNFRDLLLVLGSIPWAAPGFEGVGIVTRTGCNVKNLKVGDRVYYMTFEGGSFGTYIRAPSMNAVKIPDGFSSVDVAGLAFPFLTAYMSIIRVGRLQKGETVLIHAAAGAVGQACVTLAKHIGAQIFATAGNPTKREFLHETFGIPKSHIFSSRTSQFRDGVLTATKGKGVDVIVNSLSGNLLQETWALVAEFGRFVEIGKKDFLSNSYLGMRPFYHNVTFSGLDLFGYFQQRPVELHDCMLEMVNYLEHRIMTHIHPTTELPLSQFSTALRKLQSGQNMGKLVITMGPNERVMAECAPPAINASGPLLRPDATYLITGGTGGIGLAMGSYLIDNGAKNVVLLGRSGSSRPEVKELLEEYEGTDIRLRALACDVGDREQLEEVLNSIQDLPPIRGVIHGALYLHDAFFANATHEDWQNITRPRIQGAWNLHEITPNLDFFVILSSFLGVTGNPGQSIYAGTATFFDAFAKHRNLLGMPAVAIALPVVLDVGYVADRNLTDKLRKSLGGTLSWADLQTLMRGSIMGPQSGLNRDGKAMSLTLETGADEFVLPWSTFYPGAFLGFTDPSRSGAGGSGTSDGSSKAISLRAAANSGDPLPNLIETIILKVSAVTMIDQDEVEPDAPLGNYGLDSLVSVELRNWIVRETGIDLPLSKIVGAENLRALATHIHSQLLIAKE